MKINAKNTYYIIVIITGLLGILLTLNTLRSNNKYPNKTVIQQTLIQYYSSLPQNKNSHFINQTFPFYLSIKETQFKGNDKNFNMKYSEIDNTLVIENIDSLSAKDFSLLNSTLQHFSIDKNTTETPTVSPLLPTKIPTYRQINIFFLINENEDIEDYEQYHSSIEEYYQKQMKDTQMNIYIKYVTYNSSRPVISNKDLYGDLKALNSKFFFEEINDEDSISFFLLNNINSNSSKSNSLLYNEDLKHLIANIDLNKELNPDLLYQIIMFESIKWVIPFSELNNMFISANVFNELLKIFYSRHFQYYLLLSISMKNCDKLNRIFPLYETIRTIDKVKEKVSNDIIFTVI